jgi:hypothetical protein
MHRTTDPTVNALADQLEAERREARSLAPYNRFFLNDPRLTPILEHALRGLDEHVAEGPVPIIWCPMGLAAPSREYTRDESTPISSAAPVRYCNVCWKPTRLTVPFWVARGQYIVQVDACDSCSLDLMDKGAIPELGSRAA